LAVRSRAPTHNFRTSVSLAKIIGIYKESPVLVLFNSSESDNHWFRFFEAKTSGITVGPCCFRNLKEPTIFYETTHKEEAVLWAVIWFSQTYENHGYES
jgi:hypothetical protein